MYTHAQYDKLVKATVEEILRLSKLKGGEYAGDVDRLANFRRNGAALGLSMETIWAVYAGKHWDAIQQYVKDLQEGKTRPRAESILGRLDDLIVYSILMKAMVEEREAANKPQDGTAAPLAAIPAPRAPRKPRTGRLPQTPPAKPDDGGAPAGGGAPAVDPADFE